VLTASDGQGTSSETITIEVTQTNQAPILAGIPPLGGQEDRLVDFFLVGDDFDGDALIYRATSTLPAGADFDVSNGHFEWKPSFDQAGVYVCRSERRRCLGREGYARGRIANRRREPRTGREPRQSPRAARRAAYIHDRGK